MDTGFFYGRKRQCPLFHGPARGFFLLGHILVDRLGTELTMGRYILSRLMQMIPVLIGVTFLTFLLLSFAPSDPVTMKYLNMGVSGDAEVMEAEREGGSLVSANVFLEAVLVTILCEMLAFMEKRDEDWVPKLREAALALFADIQDCCGGRSPFEKKPYYDPYSEEKPKEQTTYRQTYFFFHDEVDNLLWDMYEELKKAGHTKDAQDAHRRMGNLIMMPFALAAAALDAGGSETRDALHRAWELGTAEWGREDIKAMEEPDERDEE